VSVLFELEGEPVAVRQGNVVGLAFHPELTLDDRIHRYFLELVRKAGVERKVA
jgi:5'-phosphate synthase pdxT subunit